MSWLTSKVHHPKLKHAIEFAELGLKRFYGDLLSMPSVHAKPALRDVMHNMGLTAYTAGSEYARSFFPMTKLGWVEDHPYTKDIDRFLDSIDTKLPKSSLDTIQEALDSGRGLPLDSLSPQLGYSTAKGVARSTLMNVYTLGALKQWYGDGVTHVKRVAIEDNRTCPVCRGLNGKEYSVASLLSMPNPQSWDTHLSCRCVFTPLLSSSTFSTNKTPSSDLIKTVNVNGNIAKNIPIEYVGVMEESLRGGALPFEVEFDNSLKHDYELKDSTLKINPKTLADEDPREIIWSEAAEVLWNKYKDRVEKEYRPLVEQGYAQSVRSWDDTHELWVNNYTGFRLGQLDNDLWSQVFMRSLS